MSPTPLWVLSAISVLLLFCAACTASNEPGASASSPVQPKSTSVNDETGEPASTDADHDTGPPPGSVDGSQYRTEELRLGLQALVDTNDNVDQLMLGVFEGQLLNRQASANRFVSRVQALEPLVIDCLEDSAGLSGETAQQFAQALLSETFGIEGPDGSIVVAFPDAVWEELGPANPEAERAADSSGCVEAVAEQNGGVFSGPVGQRYFDLVRAGQWQTPNDFEDLFAQAIADHCGPEPFEDCEDEDSAMIQMLPVYRETIRLNLDQLN